MKISIHLLLAWCMCAAGVQVVQAQSRIERLVPNVLKSGETTQVQFLGRELDQGIRCKFSFSDIAFQLERIQSDIVTATIALPATTPLGPLTVTIATRDGILSTHPVVVDDLPHTACLQSNHTRDTAQSISDSCCVSALSDGPRSHFYRMKVNAGQQIGFQILTQILHSKMDPFLQITDGSGKVVLTCDDDEVGPECRMNHLFEATGTYWLEVRDSKFASGDAYHLRVGSFPATGHAYPLAMQRETPAPIGLRGHSLATNEPQTWSQSNDAGDEIHVSFKLRDSNASSWFPILARDFPQYIEPNPAQGLQGSNREFYSIPFGVTGHLQEESETDRFWINVLKGQTIRFQTRTRSLGCPTLLTMELQNRDSVKLASTTASESDEWSIDYICKEDGELQLVVSDLLRRGGDRYAYWIGAELLEPFRVELKPSPTTKQSFAIDPVAGVAVMDLIVHRNGFKGEIQLKLSEETTCLKILNPIIPSTAKDWKLLVVGAEDWNIDSFQTIAFEASSIQGPSHVCRVSALGQRRLVEPHILFPSDWNRTRVAFAGVPSTPPFFSLACDEPVLFKKNAREQVASVSLTRLESEFKGNVTILGDALPKGWSVSTVVEKNSYKVKIQRSSESDDSIESITLFAIAEHRGRAKLQRMALPIVWVQPIENGPETLSAYPPSLHLKGDRARQQLVVSGLGSDGTVRDWTRNATMWVRDPSIAEIRAGVVYPKANGQSNLTILVGNARTEIPISVEQCSSSHRVAFESETLVALSKQGCNSGACHGSPSGKGGFRLSLRAFDAKFDERTLIQEEFSRRIDRLTPEASLLLTKPTMKTAHGGGKQLRTSDPAYSILREWIAQGARPDAEGTPRIERLEVVPEKRRVLLLNAGEQQLAVTAFFSDGEKRDVTHIAAYESSEASIATVDPQGKVTPHKSGEVAILVRVLEHIESLPLMFVKRDPAFAWTAPEPEHFVDLNVHAKLKQLQIHPSSLCTDPEFLRRSYLDLLGILPTVNESREFLEDRSHDKRTELIDRLLQRNEFAKFWALKWGDLLRLTNRSLGDDGVFKYHRWIEESFRSNLPYDQFAKQLLLSSGSTFANPAANFYRSAKDVNECVESVSQIFMGSRLQCAKCHNHPFERWTQDNYYGLAGFFQGVERRKTQRPGELFIWMDTKPDMVQPRTGKAIRPWLPDVGPIEDGLSKDPRQSFADWLVQPSNRFFARVEVNRVWRQFFSRGIVDPIDDFRASNPPSNESLLDALTNDFVKHGFNRKHLIRTIMMSNTYQMSIQPNSTNNEDLVYFSHQIPRLLQAEQLMDSISQALGVREPFNSLPESTLATQLPATDLVKVDFLKAFGQPERNTVCACERSDDSNMGMAIELLNGVFVQDKLKHPRNRFRVGMESKSTLDTVIRELFLASVCRDPTELELQSAIRHCSTRGDDALGLEDFVWALLNTDEFLFQH